MKIRVLAERHSNNYNYALAVRSVLRDNDLLTTRRCVLENLKIIKFCPCPRLFYSSDYCLIARVFYRLFQHILSVIFVFFGKFILRAYKIFKAFQFTSHLSDFQKILTFFYWEFVNFTGIHI